MKTTRTMQLAHLSSGTRVVKSRSHLHLNLLYVLVTTHLKIKPLNGHNAPHGTPPATRTFLPEFKTERSKPEAPEEDVSEKSLNSKFNKLHKFKLSN